MTFFPGLRRLTLTQQWLLATLLAVLPLVLAVSYAVWSMAEQTQQYRRLLLTTSTIKELQAAVAQQIGGLERAHLQYILLRDEAVLDVYKERLESLREVRQQLAVSLTDDNDLQTLDDLIEKLSRPEIHITEGTDEFNADDAQIFWQSINANRLLFGQQINILTQKAINDSESRYESVLQRLTIIVALAIPGTVLLIILSTVAVARPWWRLVETIKRLGEQDWQPSVKIEGPADFVELGNHLEWMRQQLLAIERQKQAFSQHITHELKSPLAAIIEAESLLRDELPGPINASQHKVLDILRDNASNLSVLIQQFLNYNTVLHNLSPEPDHINVRAAYERIRTQLAATSQRDNITWQWTGNDEAVFTDAFCLQMILSNLLSNAFKVVPQQGFIRVSLNSDEKTWQLIVEDNGPGIQKQERNKVFKPFYQGSRQQRGSLMGSGIGLSIVRECVDKLGGTIAVDDSPLGGARMTLTFKQFSTLEVKYVEASYSPG
jgi:two-component system sensor histidine kinase GlrK